MPRSLAFAVGASALFLAACTSTTAPPRGDLTVVAPGPGTTANCDAAAALSFVGQLASPEVISAAMQASHAGEVRVLPEGAGATRDFSAGRLNIMLDAAGRIAEVRCG